MNRDENGRFIKGHKHSKDVIEKNRIAHLGKRKSPQTEFKKGYRPWNTGKSLSVEIREKISKSKRGIPNLKLRKEGSNENKRRRSSTDFKEWRLRVFIRDDFTCQNCGIRGHKGIGKAVYLESHHLKSWAKFPELRFDIDNGITLCSDCHCLLDDKRRRFLRKQ